MAKRQPRRPRQNRRGGVIKKITKRGGGGPRSASRSHATHILASGVGSLPRRAFGCSLGYSLSCWDAKHPHHLPLPRAVGPYSVIRATKRIQITTIANIIGTFQRTNASFNNKGCWSEMIMVTDKTATNPISGGTTPNCQGFSMELGGLGDAATLVPSALTVQIMCPTNLQSSNGIVYAGVMNTQAQAGGRTETWDSYMNKFVQFQTPRLMAATKLALRGVEISSYPLNMAEVSKFSSLDRTPDGDFEWDGGAFEPFGWAPIVIYNPEAAKLELLITVEYRVRFDLDHPASASHRHHPMASDSMWDQLTRKAVALGHGVRDIADVVANTGAAIGRAAMVTNRVMQVARPSYAAMLGGA